MKSLVRYFSENRIRCLYISGVIFLIVSAICGIMLGSTLLRPEEISGAFSDGFKSSTGALIFGYVRLPRVIASVICGAALAVSGAVIQTVLANRLASPGIIGVNSGAGLAVTLCTAFGIYGGFSLSLYAFAGAFLTVMLVSIAAEKWGASRTTVILMGVAVNSLLGAFSNVIITFIPEVGVMSNNFRIGEFSSVTYSSLAPSSILVAAGIVFLFALSNDLDVLSLGEDGAKSLGMNTSLMRTVFLLFAALLSGCAVSIAGLLSFVGLIVPNIIRRISGNKASDLIGLCMLYGGGFVCACDTVARCIFSPYEIPVGIIMAFLGAPFFVFILVKGKEGHGNA